MISNQVWFWLLLVLLILIIIGLIIAAVNLGATVWQQVWFWILLAIAIILSVILLVLGLHDGKTKVPTTNPYINYNEPDIITPSVYQANEPMAQRVKRTKAPLATPTGANSYVLNPAYRIAGQDENGNIIIVPHRPVDSRLYRTIPPVTRPLNARVTRHSLPSAGNNVIQGSTIPLYSYDADTRSPKIINVPTSTSPNNQSYTNQMNNNQSYTNQMNNNQSYTNQMSTTSPYSNQSYPNQMDNQSYSNQMNSQSYSNQMSTTSPYFNQMNNNQSYSNIRQPLD